MLHSLGFAAAPATGAAEAEVGCAGWSPQSPARSWPAFCRHHLVQEVGLPQSGMLGRPSRRSQGGVSHPIDCGGGWRAWRWVVMNVGGFLLAWQHSGGWGGQWGYRWLVVACG